MVGDGAQGAGAPRPKSLRHGARAPLLLAHASGIVTIEVVLEYVPKVSFQRRGAEVKWEARRGKKEIPLRNSLFSSAPLRQKNRLP